MPAFPMQVAGFVEICYTIKIDLGFFMRWILVIGILWLVVWALSPNPDGRDDAIIIAPKEVQISNDNSFDKPLEKNPPPSPIVTTAEKITLFVSGSRVNVRRGPGTNHAVIGQLVQGDYVKQVSVSGGWKEIETRHGIGWMSAKYLQTTKTKAKRIPPPTERQRQIALPTTREKQQARNAIIRQSIASYAGSCPCPYNVDRGGRRCGKRSAWSRPGGASPICYDSDVSDGRLKTYFARKRGASN